MAAMPVMAPKVVMSQSPESIATVRPFKVVVSLAASPMVTVSASALEPMVTVSQAAELQTEVEVAVTLPRDKAPAAAVSTPVVALAVTKRLTKVPIPLELRSPIPVMAPAVEISQSSEFTETSCPAVPPPRVISPVEVPVPTLMSKLEEAFKLTAAPVMVKPAVPVTRPSAEMAAMPVMAPAVLISQSDE